MNLSRVAHALTRAITFTSRDHPTANAGYEAVPSSFGVARPCHSCHSNSCQGARHYVSPEKQGAEMQGEDSTVSHPVTRCSLRSLDRLRMYHRNSWIVPDAHSRFDESNHKISLLPRSPKRPGPDTACFIKATVPIHGVTTKKHRIGDRCPQGAFRTNPCGLLCSFDHGSSTSFVD